MVLFAFCLAIAIISSTFDVLYNKEAFVYNVSDLGFKNVSEVE